MVSRLLQSQTKLTNSKLPILFQESKTKYIEAVDQLIVHIQFKAKVQISSVSQKAAGASSYGLILAKSRCSLWQELPPAILAKSRYEGGPFLSRGTNPTCPHHQVHAPYRSSIFPPAACLLPGLCHAPGMFPSHQLCRRVSKLPPSLPFGGVFPLLATARAGRCRGCCLLCPQLQRHYCER